jgi:DNA-binding transcriptional regulator GbsR (MarR family)
MHQYKESTVYSMVKRHKDFELYKLLDIYLFLNSFIVSENKFIETVKKYGLQKQVFTVLRTVSQIFKTLDVEKLIKELSVKKIGFDVIDPENNNKEYKWTNNIDKRLLSYEKKKYLKEAVNE